MRFFRTVIKFWGSGEKNVTSGFSVVEVFRLLRDGRTDRGRRRQDGDHGKSYKNSFEKECLSIAVKVEGGR